MELINNDGNTASMEPQGDDGEAPPHAVSAFTSPPHDMGSEVDSAQFIQSLAQLRKVYEAQGLNRQQFNAMVCDELARRGVTPTAAAVLKAGRWGSTGHVVDDVSKWFASVADRLTARHAHIPDEVQHQAGKLFEAVWALAMAQAAEPLQTQLDAQKITFQEEIVRLETALSKTVAAAQEQAQALELANASLTQDLQQAGMDLVAKATENSVLRQELNKSQTTLEVTERALVSAQNDYMRRMSDAQAKALAEQAAKQAVHEAIVQGLNSQLTRLEGELSLQRKDAAMAIDQAREDAKDAHKRADAAQKKMDALLAEASNLKDRMSGQTIEMARLQRDHAQASDRLTAAEKLAEDLHERLVAAELAVAAAQTAQEAQLSPSK